MLDPDGLREIFDQAVSFAPGERAAFLDRACGHNTALRREIERLLGADARLGSVLDTHYRSGSPEAGGGRELSLRAGSRLGPYQILEPLGAGGMGEVYKARDTRLNRAVALKVLPRALTDDPRARARFEREARAVAALSHQHICPLFDIGRQDGTDFLVMEYVEGQTLSSRLLRGPLPLGETLSCAIDIADALGAAHRAGIVHRDLKPGNVMIAADGAVQVLDFGLAKLLSDEASPEQETVTNISDAALSMPGAIAGTAAYMSPEQAIGERVDGRSDIFSLGTMLYEMVTGHRAFEGSSVVDTLSAVIHSEPRPPTAVVTGVPQSLEVVILRCLRKEPSRRFQTATDLKLALLEVRDGLESATRSAGSRARRWSVVAGAVVTMVVTAAVAAWFLRSTGANLPQPRLVPLTTLAFTESSPTFSPDGTQVALAWNGEESAAYDIYVKIVGSTELRRLTDHPTDDFAPSWSPDGRQIAFLRYPPTGEVDGARIHLISPLGGADVKLNDFPVRALPYLPALAWSRDGRFVAAGRAAGAGSRDSSGIYLLSTEGGETRLMTRALEPSYDIAPAFSPDGRHLAYASCSSRERCHISVVELDAGLGVVSATRRLTSNPAIDVAGMAWTRDGRHVIYDTEGYLWRVGLDGASPERIEIAGVGSGSPATTLGLDRLAYTNTRSHRDVYRFVKGQPHEPVLSSSFDQGETRFSPDGQRIAFTSTRSGDAAQIWAADADGSDARQLTNRPVLSHGSPQWSPNGRQIVFDSRAPDGHWHIWIVDADGGVPRQLTPTTGDQNIPSWSRDGRWIYFSADQGNGRDMWRMPAAGGQPTRLTTNGSGPFAMESGDGLSLLYSPKAGDAPLLLMPLSGGPVRELLGCVRFRMFASVGKAIYYVPCGESPWGDRPLHRVDLSTGEDRVLGMLEAAFGTLAVSPDETTILYDRFISEGSDLWMIEHFR